MVINLASERPSMAAALRKSCLSAAVTRATNRWLLGAFSVAGTRQMYASVAHKSSAHFYAPRLHRRSACRATRHRHVSRDGREVGEGLATEAQRHRGVLGSKWPEKNQTTIKNRSTAK